MEPKWQVTPEVLSSKIDEEVILMSVEAGFYFRLGLVGSRIWELISIQPASVNELITMLMEEYEVEEATCREEVQQFIDDMSRRKLIRQVETLKL